MKKLLIWLLMLIVALGAPIFAGAQSEIGFSADTQIVYISGVLENAQNDVTILMTDSEDNVKYVNQYKVDSDGRYSAKFELYDDIGDYNVVVKEGNKIATDSIEVAYVTVPTVFSFTVRDSAYGSRIDEGELATALIEIDNKYGSGGSYTVGLACYDENNNLLGCNFMPQQNYGFWDISLKAEEDFTKQIPAGTVKVTGYLWNNLTEVKPLSNAYKRDIGDDTFGADSREVTVALIGSSTTHQAAWIAPLEHYYQTRYPGRTVNFVNKGVSGDTAEGVISRFEWDITEDPYTGDIDEAVLMIGSNDVGGNAVYPDGTDEVKDTRIAKSLANIETIINKCIEDKISLTLMSSGAYDESVEFDTDTFNNVGKNSYGLYNIQLGVKELAEEYSIPFIDLWTPTTELINAQRALGNTGTVTTQTDRVHPTEEGGFFMAYQLIKQQDEGSVVAVVDVDAETGNVTAENALAEVSSCSTSGVTYKYLANSLPLAYTDVYKNTEDVWGYKVTDEINKEIIKITNLESGSYEVTMDDASLGTYTSEALEAGINISVNSANPGQVQSMAAYEKAYDKAITVEYEYRDIANTEYQMKKYDVYTLEELEKIDTIPESYLKYYIRPYFGSATYWPYRIKANQSTTWSLIKELEAEARTLSVPTEHTVTISKVTD